MKKLFKPLPDSITSSENNTAIQVVPRKVFNFLLGMIFLLLCGHLTAFVYDFVLQRYTKAGMLIIRYFDFNLENNFPTWFSVLLLATSAMLLFIIFCYHKKAKSNTAYFWLILSLIFVFLSIDESVQIHETVAELLRPKLATDIKGFLYWAWVVPYSIIVLVLGLFFLRFVLGLPAFTRKMFIIASAVFITGALLLEFPEVYFYKIYGLNHIYNRMLYCIEELCEMSGASLFIYALLDYMESHKIKITIG